MTDRSELFRAPSSATKRDRSGAVDGAAPVHQKSKRTSRSLSLEDERKLTLALQGGDRQAGQQIVQAYLPFVMSIALEYRRWGVPLEDVVQEGCIGLIKAAERFEPDRGCRLVTYAAYWVRAQIRDYVVRGYRIVRIGASKSERRALRLYRRTRERDPEVLAAQSGMSRDRAEALLPLLMARDVSLDVPEGSSALELTAALENPEDHAMRTDEQAKIESVVRQVVDELPLREQQIIRLRWMTDEPRTLEELGAQFGISKERVRQLEARVMGRLRGRLQPYVRPSSLPLSA